MALESHLHVMVSGKDHGLKDFLDTFNMKGLFKKILSLQVLGLVAGELATGKL